MQAQGIGEEHFRQFSDGGPLRENEGEVLYRILVRLQTCPPAVLDRWAAGATDLARLVAQPASSRGAMCAVRGRILSLESEPLPTEAARRFNLRQCLRGVIMTEGGKAVVYTDRVPLAWQKGKAVGQRVEARAVFLKLSGKEPSEPLPLLVSPRLAWYPATSLGNLGVDAALLDDVRDRTPLRDADREIFYQLLAAVRRGDREQLFSEAAEQSAGSRGYSSVTSLFNEPASWRGRLVRLSGTTRRIVRVDVEDADIRSRFGIDHYYEIDLFTADSQGNPVVLCAPELPQGCTSDGCEPMELVGFFVKQWRFPATAEGDGPDFCEHHQTPARSIDWQACENGTLPVAGGKVGMQDAPLLIGPAPRRPASPGTAGRTSAASAAGWLLALVLTGVMLLLWHVRQSDSEFSKKVLAIARRER